MKKIKRIALLLAALLIVAAVIWTVQAIRQTTVGLEVDQRINLTPEQITSIKDIGEWEFLTIANEEIVDTVRTGFFTDDHLARIYYGTVRLGINMHHVKPGWIKAMGDTLLVTLPDIGLLDHDFIDEARTKSFYESGRWEQQDRETLYRKAHRQMLRHSMTPENINKARQNGEIQFRRMMKAIGYPNIKIEWKD